MNNIIVRETSSEIKTIARMALRNNWGKIFAGMFIYYILMSFIPGVIDCFFPPYEVYNPAIDQNMQTAGISSLYTFLLTGAFTVGVSGFVLAFFRLKEINYTHIFDGFEHYFKTLALFIVMTIFIGLWSLLFVIPGIIAAFSYSQAFTIMADDPGKGVMQCIRESKMMMKNNKTKYFMLNLSFIGWVFLAIFIASLILGVSLTYKVSGIALEVVDLVSAIPLVFLLAYMNTANITFYELASGHLKAKSDEPEIGPQNNPIDDNYFNRNDSTFDDSYDRFIPEQKDRDE